MTDLPSLPAAIAEGVWLGSAMHAERPLVLATLGIRRVVCVMDDPGGCAAGGPVPVRRWSWVDTPGFPIRRDLDDVVAAIADGRRAGGGGVLVHCFQGKSRSAAAVLAWMAVAEDRGADVDELHAELQRHRSIVQINDGFLDQLRAWLRARRAAGTAAGV